VAAAPPWSFDLHDDTRAVLAHGLDGEVRRRDEPLDGDRWQHLRSDCDLHRLDGLLVEAVASGALPTTDEQRAEAAELEIELTGSRMWHERWLVDTVADLESAGVEIRVLKGAALAALDYPDRQWRPTGDLDLLVRGDQIDRACARLEARGGTRADPDPTPGYAATVGKGATVSMARSEVDLHRTLVWGPFGVRIRVDDLWSDPRPFTVGDSTLATLGLEQTLLHACYHLLVCGWPRALTLRDVAQLVDAPGLDEDRVLWLARRSHGEAILASALLLARREVRWTTRSPLLAWADGFVAPIRDRVWLRIERPGDFPRPFQAASTYLAMLTPADRAVLRRATFRPVPGTWPSAAERARRAVGALQARLPRPASPT
jgi:hypothetical protein